MKRFAIVLAVMLSIFCLSGIVFAETIGQGIVPKERKTISEYDKALDHYNKGEYQQSINILKDYIKKTPDPWGYWLMGYSLYKLKRFNEANRYFKDAFLVDPSFSPTPTLEKDLNHPYEPARPQGYPEGMAPSAGLTPIPKLQQGTTVVTEPAPAPAKPAPAPAKPVSKAPAPATSTPAKPAPTVPAPSKPAAVPSPAVPAPATPAQVPAPATTAKAPETTPPPAGTAVTPPTPLKPVTPPAPQAPQAPAQPKTPAQTTPPPPSPKPVPSQTQKPVKPFKPGATPFPAELTPQVMIAFVSAMIFTILIGFVIASLVAGVFIFLLAKKLQVRLAVLGFIPIIQFWILAACAGMSTLMTILLGLLMLIPVLWPIIFAIIFMQVAGRLGKSKVLGLILGFFIAIVPLIWFAFAGAEGAAKSKGAAGGMDEMPDLSGEPDIPDLDFDLEEDEPAPKAKPATPAASEELPPMADDDWSLPEEGTGGGAEQSTDEWQLPDETDEAEQSADEWQLPDETDEGEQSVDDWQLPQDDE